MRNCLIVNYYLHHWHLCIIEISHQKHRKIVDVLSKANYLTRMTSLFENEFCEESAIILSILKIQPESGYLVTYKYITFECFLLFTFEFHHVNDSTRSVVKEVLRNKNCFVELVEDRLH